MSYSFPEEMKRGSVIGNIAKDLGLETGAVSKRRARIDTDGSDKRYCDINLNNGELIVADRIDREGLCGEKASCVLKHELVLENPLELHRITLHIQDINDNSPQFKEEMINIEIRESADRGARFVIEEAHDADVGQNSVQQYSLKKNENFILAADGNTIELVLRDFVKSLIRGSPQDHCSVVIHVTVLDANDNAPVFSQAVYKASLPENSPPDNVVVTVSATDADEGVNGDVTYEFGHVTEDVKKIFSIDRKMGEIRVIGTVDYESTTSFEIRVKAKDGLGLSSYAKLRSFKVQVTARDNGSPPLSSNVTVSVFISDVNDNSPQILYPAPEGNSFMTELVPKAAHGGSLVSKVIAVDADTGQNAWLSYHIVKSTDPGLFTIGVHSGEIRTQRDISESDSMKQNLIVAVKDNGQPSLSATCSMYLLISDNLAEVPELKDISYDDKNSKLTSYLIIALVCVSTFFLTFIIIILEEMQRGSIIGNVARDLGLKVTELGARRARVVAEGTRQLCELDTASGNLLISQRIDREELCAQTSVCILQYQLLLENPLQAFSLVLDIADINDNSPAFAAEEIKLDLVESTVLGRRFPLESAHDPDLGTNSVREYKLSLNDHFALELSTQINGNTYLELVLKKALDREAQAQHVLKINAIDGGNPVRSGTASIHIRVLDANDNVPVFSQRVYKASVPENSPIGTVIAALNATDVDEGVYGDITYSFSHLSDTVGGVVDINPLTGEVRVAGAIDYEEASMHELDVQAKDGGGQASHCKLVIDVIDVNDNKPVIEIKSASANVAEDSKPGTMVALINVYDLDTGASGRVTCTIPDYVPFKIVSEVKNYYMLVTDEILDREVQPEYNITVTATDAGSPSLSSVKVITIVVKDINDNAPTFTQSEYSANVLENQPVGTFVMKVKAEDIDDASNAKILYQISRDASSDASSFLTISSETGELFTSRLFDYEQSVHFQIKVMARDGGAPPLSTTCAVNVFIKDQNDNAPVVLYPLQSSGYIAEDMVPVEAPKGYLVTKVVAVDADSGHNAWLSYRIIRATRPNLFTVGQHTGEIRTVRAFAEDDEPKHTVIVLVSDNGPESLSATVTVSIAIGVGLPVLNELFEMADDSQDSDDLTLYLIVALISVSSLLVLLIGWVFYFKLCRRGYVYRSTAANLPVFPAPYCAPSFTDFSRCRTLLKDERYDSFLTTGSWRGDFRFGSNTDTDTLKKRKRSLSEKHPEAR
ncbi:hypothetical protein L3Q82_020572 [Scortum barcoo]|uniref:Uncharacterized protein n=1 Tax=Scortum barcoo TaxID=214431 RepID=A0ACB8V877_9TELE|nr:hypothetical protein L3Q82_020572 [Scortum barcoo]